MADPSIAASAVVHGCTELGSRDLPVVSDAVELRAGRTLDCVVHLLTYAGGAGVAASGGKKCGKHRFASPVGARLL